MLWGVALIFWLSDCAVYSTPHTGGKAMQSQLTGLYTGFFKAFSTDAVMILEFLSEFCAGINVRGLVLRWCRLALRH